MKNKILVISCFLLFLPLSIGNALESVTLDGYQWSKWNISMKLGFVMGWAESGRVMINEIPQIITFASFGRCGNDHSDSAKKKIAEGFSKEKGLILNDLTFDQIVGTIDKVYSDPRVKAWEIGEIMPLVRGRLKEGWTEKDLDEVIAYMIRQKTLSKKWATSDFLSKSEQHKVRGELFVESLTLNEPEALKALRDYIKEYFLEYKKD